MSKSRIILILLHLICFLSFFSALTHAQTGTHVHVEVDRTAVGMCSIMGKAAYVDAESNDTIGIANAKLKMVALPKSSLVVESKAANYVVEKKDVGIILLKKKNQ